MVSHALATPKPDSPALSWYELYDDSEVGQHSTAQHSTAQHNTAQHGRGSTEAQGGQGVTYKHGVLWLAGGEKNGQIITVTSRKGHRATCCSHQNPLEQISSITANVVVSR